MSSNIKKADPIFDYYQQELDVIYSEANEFAIQYPKVAAALGLGKNGSRDPQIERLLESFSFISARLRKDIDDEFPRIPEALISVLYPYLIRPVPSSTIIRMDVSGAKGALGAGFDLKRGVKFFCENDKGVKIPFVNCYNTKLFALDVQSVEIKKAEELEIDKNINMQLESRPGLVGRFLRVNFKHILGDIDFDLIDTFDIFLQGNKTQKRILHEIFSLSKLSFIEPLGFNSAQSMISIEKENHPAYRLLFEYFNYIDKFFFFRINLKKALSGQPNMGQLIIKGGINNKKDEFDLLIPISDSIKLQGVELNKTNIITNCVPVINLFETTSEPINVDHKKNSYPVYGDSYLMDDALSIYSIKDVYSTDGLSPSPKRLKPFFGFDHNNSDDDVFWSVQYKDKNTNSNKDYDARLSFQGFDYHNLSDQLQKTVYAELLVSNARAAEEIQVDSEFYAETMIPADKIYNLTPITNFKAGISDGSLLWKLVAHLSINHTSLSNDDDSLKSLKEIMKIYERSPKGMRQQEIDGIKELSTSLTTMHVGDDAWRGFVNGIKIKLRFDDDFIENGNALLFASVMNRFFALTVSSNSFSKLEIYKENESNRWYTWQPVMGTQDLL